MRDPLRPIKDRIAVRLPRRREQCNEARIGHPFRLGCIAFSARRGNACDGFSNASKIADLSTLPPFFASAFKGLWLTDSVSSITLGLIFALVAARPQWTAGPVRLFLALLPIALAVVIFATMGNFFAGYMMLVAGAAALGGALTGAVSASNRTANT
jgi:hypothetical protein